jgi:hypothetical protein
MNTKNTMDYVRQLPISDEAKEFYGRECSGNWTLKLNKPTLRDLISVAELQSYGCVEISVVPNSADALLHESDVAEMACPEEYNLLRKLGKLLGQCQAAYDI